MPGNDQRVVEGVYECVPVFFLQFESLVVGVVIDPWDEAYLCAEFLGGFYL